VQVVNVYGEAMSAGKQGTAGHSAQSVPSDDLFAMMGAKVKRANHG
jgi:hypothetical protein